MIYIVSFDVSLNVVKTVKGVGKGLLFVRTLRPQDPAYCLVKFNLVTRSNQRFVFYGTGISPRLVQESVCLEGASNKGLFPIMLLHVTLINCI